MEQTEINIRMQHCVELPIISLVEFKSLKQRHVSLIIIIDA
jgi:hypothetical protein